MLDSDKKSEFLREGLTRYPDARETVDYFQAAVLETIFATFASKEGWRNFHPRRNAEDSLGTGKFVGAIDRYIQAWVRGTIANASLPGDNAWLCLGLYWRPAKRPNIPVVAACHAWAEKGVPVPMNDERDRDKSVLLGSLFRRGDRRLFLEPGNDIELEDAFRLLLDTADVALAPRPSSV